MVLGIIGALQEEVALLCSNMQSIRQENSSGINYFSGTICDQEVIVVQSGIGKINAAICTQILISDYHVDAIINVGVAGSLDSSLHILDVVVSDRAVFHDIDLDMYERYFPFQRYYPADSNLIESFRMVLEKQQTAYQVGLVATGDDFIEDSRIKQDIVKRLKPLCVEMEGAAIAQTAFVNQIPFVILRVISDGADDNATNNYDNFLELAAKKSSELVMKFLLSQKTQ